MENLRKSLPPLSSLLPFEATARLGSVTQASAELGLTQAAVSKQIRALEENLGTVLFERRNRALHLTEKGRGFALKVSQALSSVGASAAELRQHEGDVVLRSQLCEGLYWLMPRLSGFYQKHPNIPVRVSVSTEPITEADERFDLALQTKDRESGTAEAVFTACDEVFPVCSPGYLGRKKKPLPMERLSNLSVLHHRVEPKDWIEWDDWLEGVGSDLRVGANGMIFDSYPMMMQAVLEGHGIALGWRRTVEHFLETKALVRPFQDQLSVPDSLIVYKPAREQLREGASVLLDWLKTELS